MIYAILALVSLGASALIIVILYNVNTIIDTVKHWGEKRTVASGRNLQLLRYVVPSSRHPSGMEIRHTPHPSRPPSPVYDGKIRRPWGW